MGTSLTPGRPMTTRSSSMPMGMSSTPARLMMTRTSSSMPMGMSLTPARPRMLMKRRRRRRRSPPARRTLKCLQRLIAFGASGH